MDTFSSEAELVNIHTAFYQSLFDAVVSFDTSGFSDSNRLAVSLLKLRARLALRQYDAVLTEVKALSGPEYRAVEAAATYLKAAEKRNETAMSAALETAAALSKKEDGNANVQLLTATVLAAAGQLDDALAALLPHKTKIDVVALIVQLHLLQNRLDLAKQEVEAAKDWAQDNVVINVAESWVYLREGGDNYQSAFYVFEELASSANTQTAGSLLGQAVAEIHLGRLDEAADALSQADKLASADPAIASAVVANRIVLNTLAAKPVDDDLASLDPHSALARDLAEKKAEFATLAAEYQAGLVSKS